MIYEERVLKSEMETPSRYPCQGSLPAPLPTSQNTDVFHGSGSRLTPAQSHEKGRLNMSLGRGTLSHKVILATFHLVPFKKQAKCTNMSNS